VSCAEREEEPGGEAGTGPAGDQAGAGRLAGIREAVEELVRQLDGPVARVSVRSGETSIEVEWSRPAPEEQGAAPAAAASEAQAMAAAPVPAAANGAAAADRADDGLHAVLAPLVGTFYVAPEPNASPFVQPGDLVDVDTTIGIIEAMKMMNHIGAERAGRVAELLVANGETVEFGQELVRIEPMDA
jgi:acetyl-CoA carboxylase biotin carboxyl carrier protein